MNRTPIETSERTYNSLADYAEYQGAPVAAFIGAGWLSEIVMKYDPNAHKQRPAFQFETPAGRRWRFIDGKQGNKYISVKGFKRDWYGLDNALALAKQSGRPLVMVNGEAGTTVAQHYGLPAFCLSAGEVGNIPEHRLNSLKTRYSGEILIALDCDAAGRTCAAKRAAQLIAAGYVVQALDLQLGDKGDIANFCKLYGNEAYNLLQDLPTIEPEQPKTATIKPNLAQRETTQPAPGAIDWDSERRMFWTGVVLPAVERATTRQRSKHFYCVNPHHNDSNPSARISTDKDPDGLYICTCGTHSRDTVAGWLGLDFMTWWKDNRQPLYPRQKRAQSVSKASPVWPPELTTVDLESVEADIIRREQYLSTFPNVPTLAIRSPLGTGKTAATIRHIGSAKRVLYITFQESLTKNFVERINAAVSGQAFELYNEIPGNFPLGTIDRLVCSLNSLPRIGVDAEAYDIVIIDEIEQVMPAIWDGTLRGRETEAAFTTLKNILSRAGQIIVLDAHLSQQSVGFLKSIRGDCTVLKNTYKRAWGSLTVHQNEAAVIAAAQNLADQNNGCVVITTGSRKAARRYRRIFEARYGAEAVRLIYGWNSNSKDARRFLKAINDELPKLRVFICSPTVGTGVDVQARVAGVFGHFTGGHLAATDILQQIARYRNADQRGIYIERKVRHALITDADELLFRERTNIRRTADLAGFKRYGVVNVTPTQGEITKLWAAYIASRNRQQIDTLAYFVALAQREGFEIQWSSTEAPDMKAALKAAQATQDAEDENKVLTLAPVSRNELDYLRMSGELSEDDHLANLRWRIEDTTGQTIGNDLFKRYKTSNQRAALRRFTDYLQVVEVTRQKDRDNVAALPFKRQHHTAQRRLYELFLHAAYGEDGLNSKEVTPEPELTRRLTPVVDDHLEEIRRIDRRPDLSSRPIAVFKRVLKWFSVRLDSKEIWNSGDRCMTYWLDRQTLEVLIADAGKRLAHLETLSKIAEDHHAIPVIFENPIAPVAGAGFRPLELPGKAYQPPPKGRPLNPFAARAAS